MKIDKTDLSRFRNDEHFQFHTEIRDAINKFGAGNLKIDAQFETYLFLYAQEDQALKKIMKSALTAEIQSADKQRDQIFRGMIDTHKAAMNHFKPELQEAARRLKIPFDTYGNLAAKPLNEQTSGVYNLLQDMNGKYLGDAQTIHLTEWMDELQTANDEFSQLMKNRFEESAMQCDLVLKEVRQQVDETYRSITARINALVVVEGEDPYREFIKYCNTVIAKYATIVAKRAGKKKVG